MLLLSAGQLLFKTAALGVAQAPIDDFVFSLLKNPWFLIALVLYGAATLIWLSVLRSAPLSQAYALFSLSFVLVPLCASVCFQEPLGWRYAVGSVLIIGGITLCSGINS